MLGRPDLELLWLGMLVHSWTSTAQGGTWRAEHVTHMGWTDMHLGFSKKLEGKRPLASPMERGKDNV